jgi:hypothetical protein
VKIKGEKERIDSPSQPTQIIDGKSGEMANLMNDKKKFIRITADQMKAAVATIDQSRDEKKDTPEKKLVATGRKESVGGYETEEFVYQTPQFKAAFWVAKNYPDAANILKQMQAPFSGAWKPSNMGMPDYTDFPGLPLKTVISVGNDDVTTTITSIKKDPLNSSEFEIPKDFEEVKRPARGVGAPSGQSPAASLSPTP